MSTGTGDCPNVLFVCPDQHRSDWVGYHGTVPVRTPTLDRFAGAGEPAADPREVDAWNDTVVRDLLREGGPLLFDHSTAARADYPIRPTGREFASMSVAIDSAAVRSRSTTA